MSDEMQKLVLELNSKLPEKLHYNGVDFNYQTNGICEGIQFLGFYLWDCQNYYDDMLEDKILKKLNITEDEYPDEYDYEDAVQKVFPSTPTSASILLMAQTLMKELSKGLKSIDLTSV